MKYALLIYTTPGMVDGFTGDELEAMSNEYYALRDEPGCLEGGQLADVDNATTVRVNGGGTLTTDGPFAETKEVFAGYYVFELDDLDAAIAMAARVPAARLGGSVEVRPLMHG
ncbi:MAG TPA: YciI family protein [Solirubrobacteraceae bacterium]|nr:YciI family protein [Solirubrobacteraceae bacterium]